MGVKVITRNYNNSFRPETVDWLIGNVGEWQRLSLYVEFAVEKRFTQSSPLLLQSSNIATLGDGTDWSSYGFDVNESVVINFDVTTYDSSGAVSSGPTPVVATRTIGLIAGDTVEFTTPFGVGQSMIPYKDGQVKFDNVIIYKDKQPQGVEITYGHIENSNYASSSLNSFIDGTETKMNALNLHTLPNGPLNFIGLQSGMSLRNGDWDYAGKIGTHTYGYSFGFEFMISSFFEDITDIENKTPPSQVFNAASLTDNFKIIGFPEWNNPNTRIQNKLSDTKRLGNTGWFDENFNGLDNDFVIESITYTDVDSASLVSALSYSSQTRVKAVISGVQNLANGSTNCGLGFIWLPEDEDLYKNNQQPFHNNMLMNTAGSYGVNNFLVDPAIYAGLYNGFGADPNIKMEVEDVHFYIDGTDLVYEATFSPTTGFKNKMDALDESERNYAIWVSVADHTLTSNFSNRVSLLLDYNIMEFYVAPVGPWEPLTMTFYEHQNDGSSGSEPCFLDMFVEDDLVAKIDFKVDISDVIPNAIEFGLEMVNAGTGEILSLQSYNVDLSGYPNDSNGIPQWSYDQTRGFKLESGNSKNWVKVERNPTFDNGIEKAYTAFYGYKIRWEDWLEKLGVPGDFFDSNELFNGFNNDWYQYLNTLGWDFKFVVYLDAVLQGEAVRYKNEVIHTFKDYDSNGDITTIWNFYRESDSSLINAGIDADTGKPLGVILDNEQVRLEIIYTRATGTWSGINDVYATTCIEVDKGSGQFEFRQISSIWGRESDNPLIPIPNETLLKLTLLSPTEIKAECLVEPSLLLDAIRYKCSGRLGCKLPITPTWSAKLDVNHIGGSSGLWDFDFEFATTDGVLSAGIITMKVYNYSTNALIGHVDYPYGAFPQVDAPLNDYIGNWVSDVQPYLQVGTQLIDGGSGGFTKKDWAYDNDKFSDAYYANAIPLKLKVKIETSNNSSAIMSVKKDEIGANIHGFSMRYSAISDSYFGAYSRTSNTQAAVSEIKIFGDELLSNTVANYNIPGFTSGTNFGSVGLDEQFLVNGKPTLYNLKGFNNPTPNYPWQLSEYTWNGTDGYNENVLISGNGWNGRATYPLRIFSLNGKSLVLCSNFIYSPNSRPDMWRMFYFDGVSWQYSVFDTLMLETGGSGNPNDDNYTIISDDYGRVYYHRRKEFTQTTSRIDMIVWDGVGAIEDENSWTRTFLCGSNSAHGFVDGIGNVARMTRPHSFTIIGYDAFTFPIIQFWDYDNAALRQMNYDDPSGQMNLTTIATMGVDAGCDYQVANMAFNGSEYMCALGGFGFFTMTTSGVQTLLDEGVPSSKVNGEKY